MSPAYDDTKIPVSRSKGQIEELLAARGVTDTRFTTTATLFAVEFNWPLQEKIGECPGSGAACWAKAGKWHGNNAKPHPITKVVGVLGVRMVAPWPADEREQRRIARVVMWHLKTKLETVEAGVLTFSEEFLPHLTLGRGRRVWDEFRPRLEAAIADGRDLSVAMEPIAGETAQRALPDPAR